LRIWDFGFVVISDCGFLISDFLQNLLIYE